MAHPDEGTIRAFLDGELHDGRLGVGRHLEECARCAGVVSAQEEALSVLSQGLALTDVPPAPSRVRRLISETRSQAGKRHRKRVLLTPGSLPKAASLAILVTAGAAAALPGSPVRGWIARGWESFSSQAGGEPAVPETSAAPSAAEGIGPGETGAVGASIPLKAGGLTVRIHSVEAGSEVTVRLVDGSQVGVFAGKGTRFRTESGLMEANEASGPVTVEIPRQAEQVVVVVEGVTVLRQGNGRTEVLAPVLSRTPDEIRFLPSGDPGSGGSGG